MNIGAFHHRPQKTCYFTVWESLWNGVDVKIVFQESSGSFEYFAHEK